MLGFLIFQTNSTETVQQSAIPLNACSLEIEQNIPVFIPYFSFVSLHSGPTHLDCFLFHRHRSANVVQFVVQAAGIAHRITVLIATPQRCRVRLAVRAQQIVAPGCTLQRRECVKNAVHLARAQKKTFRTNSMHSGLIIFRFGRAHVSRETEMEKVPPTRRLLDFSSVRGVVVVWLNG